MTRRERFNLASHLDYRGRSPLLVCGPAKNQTRAAPTVRDVDIGQLLARLRSMGPARVLALVDGCERLQALIQRNGWRPTDELLADVGLIGRAERGAPR